MSNLAKDWQEGSYTVRIMGNLVEASKVYKDKVDGHVCCKKSSAQAKCNPEDEFSLSMGVALAMDRLNKELSKNKIEVGDKVKIKDIGFSCPTFVDWIKRNIGNVKLAACFAYGQYPKVVNIEYIVKAIAPWGVGCNKDKLLAYVQQYVYDYGTISNNQPCYLIEVDGLEKV